MLTFKCLPRYEVEVLDLWSDDCRLQKESTVQYTSSYPKRTPDNMVWSANSRTLEALRSGEHQTFNKARGDLVDSNRNFSLFAILVCAQGWRTSDRKFRAMSARIVPIQAMAILSRMSDIVLDSRVLLTCFVFDMPHHHMQTVKKSLPLYRGIEDVQQRKCTIMVIVLIIILWQTFCFKRWQSACSAR